MCYEIATTTSGGTAFTAVVFAMSILVKMIKPNYRTFCFISLLAAFLMVNGPVSAQPLPAEAEKAQSYYSVEGAVQRPDRFPLTKNVRIKNAIEKAGGLTKDGDRKQAEIIRFNKRQKVYYTIYFQVENALSGDLTDNLILLDQDRIIIHNVQEKAAKRRIAEEKAKAQDVIIAGAIAKPGAYPFAAGMTVRDLVVRSGGTLKTSYPERAEILSPAPGANRRIINLKKALDDDPAHNVPLGPNDRLVVKDRPNEGNILPEIGLSGEILLPGKYPIAKGERLSSVIERAGGYRPEANPRAAVFTRQQVRKLQQSRLDEMAARIERELPRQNPVVAGEPEKSADNNKDKRADAEIKLKVIEQLKTLRVTGRVLIASPDADSHKKRLPDAELEDGDNIYLPPISETVRVAGAVNEEGLCEFRSSSSYQDYITAAKGQAQSADKAAIFVIKPDGSIRRPATAFFEWNQNRKRLEIGGAPRANQIIETGDTIVVPEKIPQPAWLKDIYHLVLTLKHNGIVPPAEMKSIW